MKRFILLGALSLLWLSNVKASPSAFTPLGPNISFGDNSNNNTVFSTLANPSSFSILKHRESQFGLAVNFQSMVELDGLEGSMDYLDKNIKPYMNSNNPADATILASNFDTFFSDYNSGKFTLNSAVSIPMAIQSSQWGGNIFISYTYLNAQQINLIKQATISTAGTGTDVSINSGAAALGMNYKSLGDFNLGYGIPVFKYKKHLITLGTNLHYLSLQANSKIIDLQTFVNDNLGTSKKDASDYIKDMRSGQAQSAFTADLGLSWIYQNISVGLIGLNLTAPSFKINDLSSSADSLAFSNSVESTFKLKSQYRLSTQFNTVNQDWSFAGSYDLVKANDLNNQDTQWWSMSVNHFNKSIWYIPDTQIGLRGNLVGNKYIYTNLGIRIAFFNLDVSATIIDLFGMTQKQKNGGVTASAGVEFTF